MHDTGHLKVLLYQKSSMHTENAFLKIFVLNIVKHRIISTTRLNPLLLPPHTQAILPHHKFCNIRCLDVCLGILPPQVKTLYGKLSFHYFTNLKIFPTYSAKFGSNKVRS